MCLWKKHLFLDKNQDMTILIEKEDFYASNKRTYSLKSQYGELQIDVPMDREGEFGPKLIPKYQQDISGIEESSIARII